MPKATADARTEGPDLLLPTLPKAIGAWRKRDPVLAGLAKAHPPHAVPSAGDHGFQTMLHAIVAQQVSLAAGRAIWGRLKDGLGTVAPAVVASTPHETLRSFGLSRAKASYAVDLAQRTLAGALPWERFPDMEDSAVVDALTAVKGIGPWTAKIFLLFHLQRPDVVVPEDLGLQDAVARFYGVRRDLAAAFLGRQASAWSPHASLACRVLWEARGALLQRDGQRRTTAASAPKRTARSPPPPSTGGKVVSRNRATPGARRRRGASSSG